MAAFAPIAIIAGLATAVGLLFYACWDSIATSVIRRTKFIALDLERANVKTSSEQLVIGSIIASLGLWVIFIMMLKPTIALALVGLAAIFAGTLTLGRAWIRSKIKKRINAFNNQLEMVLRLLSNGLRVGLGLRQAIVLVTEEMDEPARTEFARVFGATNIGVPLNDALDALARRMPSDELRMLVDAIAVQSQTGGNMAKILDHLALTIKGRRAVKRKIKALTGEAIAGSWILGALPVLVGAFIIMVQPPMRDTMLFTAPGHVGLLIFAGLEALGIFTLVRLLSFEV